VVQLAFHPAWGENEWVRSLRWLGLLVLLLSGCLKTEAKLTWHPDGSMDFVVRPEGDVLESQGGKIARQLRLSGFRELRLGPAHLGAIRLPGSAVGAARELVTRLTASQLATD